MKSHFRRHQELRQKLLLSWEESLPLCKWEHLKTSFKTLSTLKQCAPDSVYNWRSRGDEWFLPHVRPSDFLEIEEKDRVQMAAQWLREAVFELKSAETWNSLMLELLASGAPLKLVKGCSRAFVDEIEHARLGYSMVKALCPTTATFGAPPTRTMAEEIFQRTDTKNDENFNFSSFDSEEQRFQIALRALTQGVWVQELASRFSIHLSRDKTYGSLVADLLKKSVDEHRHSDLHWDIFSWAMLDLEKEYVERLWTLWSNHPKPKFQNLLVGEGRGRDIAKEMRVEMLDRLKRFFAQNFSWEPPFETNSEKPLPISRPAS